MANVTLSEMLAIIVLISVCCCYDGVDGSFDVKYDYKFYLLNTSLMMHKRPDPPVVCRLIKNERMSSFKNTTCGFQPTTQLSNRQMAAYEIKSKQIAHVDYIIFDSVNGKMTYFIQVDRSLPLELSCRVWNIPNNLVPVNKKICVKLMDAFLSVKYIRSAAINNKPPSIPQAPQKLPTTTAAIPKFRRTSTYKTTPVVIKSIEHSYISATTIVSLCIIFSIICSILTAYFWRSGSRCKSLYMRLIKCRSSRSNNLYESVNYKLVHNTEGNHQDPRHGDIVFNQTSPLPNTPHRTTSDKLQSEQYKASTFPHTSRAPIHYFEYDPRPKIYSPNGPYDVPTSIYKRPKYRELYDTPTSNKRVTRFISINNLMDLFK